MFEHNSKLAEQEPDWSEVDKTRLPRIAFAEKGEEGEKSSWKFPHHFVEGGGELNESGIYEDGTLYLHKGGLAAARAAAEGARSGEEASDEVKAHLAAHAEAIEETSTAEETDAGQAQPVVQFSLLRGVEIAEFPCTDAHGVTWDIEDARDLVSTFARYGGRQIKPPLVLAHDEKHPLVAAMGMPALGWVRSLALKGRKLVADIKDVPFQIADLIRKGAYKRISGAWWYDGRQAGLPAAKRRPVLRHVGLLGADTPAIKTLADVQALYTAGRAPTARFANEGRHVRVATFQEVAASAAEEPETLQEAIQQHAAAEELEPVFRAIHDRLWLVQDREGRSEEEIFAALKELAAEIQEFLAAYKPGETGAVEEAAATMTGRGGARVAKFQEAPATAGPEEPPDLKAAIQQEVVGEALEPLFRAISERIWLIQDREGRTEAEMTEALRTLAEEIQEFLAAYKPGGPEAVQEAAAAMTDRGGQKGGQAATGAKPAPGIGPVAAMSDAARDQVSALVARLTAEGRLAPKHVPAIRAQAAAMFAVGGDEALIAYLDDQDSLRQGKVVALGETGTAEFADPTADAAAEAEYERFGFGRSLGITCKEYVRARRQMQKS